MSERIVVSTKDGKVKGVKRISEYSGAEYYSFYGVPYGQPPTNTLRYKDPIKVKPWKDIFDATKEKPGCVQFSLKNCRLLGTEDCLFNNIHTPELPSKTTRLRAVIAFIHPGSFLHGSPNETDFGMTAFVMHRDIVYVGIGHRLHMLGFLNLGIKECSGNQTVKDIILSLHWIQDNIHFFGGDPENVTLLGSSSGAAVCHILLLSPLGKGLFHKAAIMGCYLFDPSHLVLNTNEEFAFKIAKSFGYKGTVDDKKKLLSFIKKLDPMLLVASQRKLQNEVHQKQASLLPMGLFLPSLDESSENPVFPKHPRELIQSTTRVPLMMGFGDLESALGFCRSVRENTINNFITTIRQNAWGWGNQLSDEDLQLIKKEVEAFYSQGKPIEKSPLMTMINVQTGVMLSDVYDTLINVVASTPESPVYLYRFQFEGDMKTMKSTFINLFDERLEGTFHGDDAFYWGHMNDPPTDKSKEMVETITNLVSTFAKIGDPNFEDLPVQWTPTRPEAPCYLSINDNLKMVDGRLHDEKLQFWDKIKKQFQINLKNKSM